MHPLGKRPSASIGLARKTSGLLHRYFHRAIAVLLTTALAVHFLTPHEPSKYTIPAAHHVTSVIPLHVVDEKTQLKVERSGPTRFILYRAIGNDLPPRHAIGQTQTNLRYILDHEPMFPHMEKRFVVNRIVDEEQEKMIISLLQSRNESYTHIPFILSEYAQREIRYQNFGHPDIVHSKSFLNATKKQQAEIIDAMLHDKNTYAMNNNGARNHMLNDGIRAGAEWVMPFDANCFMTTNAWDEILHAVNMHGASHKYFAVPMARLMSNDDLARPDFRPIANEEPQVMFRSDANERFNENMRYGRRPKVELLWRLKVSGPWDKWPQSIGPWESVNWTVSKDINGSVLKIGWIPRMFSGNGKLELGGAVVQRGLSRSQGVADFLTRVDSVVARERGFRAGSLLAWNETILTQEKHAFERGENRMLNGMISRMIAAANASLKHGPFSVMHKLKVPPSGDKHDYYTPSPYYWPSPRGGQFPWVRRDGIRVPGTILYDDQSEDYDRSRLSSLFGNTTCLALAWFFTGEMSYAMHAANNIRAWFIDAETRMNPSMRYAQIRWGHDGNVGANYGIIETKDLYFLLDAVTLLHRSRAFSDFDMANLSKWLREFATYLTTSLQGVSEYSTTNNHGVYYDIQLSAIAFFLNDFALFQKHTEFAKGRILAQFANDGSLPEEMSRKTQLHYMMFGLQGFYILGEISRSGGVDMWGFNGSIFCRAAQFALPQLNATWTNRDEGKEDMDRMLPLYYLARERCRNLIGPGSGGGSKKYGVPVSLYAAKSVFNPHDGIRPYWNLGMSLSEVER